MHVKHFVFVTQMFIFSLDYEMWSVLLFLFCVKHFVFVTQMFIFSLEYEMWSVLLCLYNKTDHISYSREKINICVTNTKCLKQNKNNKTDHIS
jgi:hypothetical protein